MAKNRRQLDRSVSDCSVFMYILSIEQKHVCLLLGKVTCARGYECRIHGACCIKSHSLWFSNNSTIIRMSMDKISDPCDF